MTRLPEFNVAVFALLPVLGIGLSPLLQWLVLPLLVVWFVRRQVAA